MVNPTTLLRLPRQLFLRLRSLFCRNQVEHELDTELRFHLDRQIEENIAAGMTPDEARYAALRTIGIPEQLKEQCRDTRRLNLLDGFIQDLRYAFRQLRKSPGFTTVAVLSLALGIGANTAIFSVVNAVLLRPLPYKNPERLVLASSDMQKRNVKDFPFSNADFFDLRTGTKTVFEGIAAVSTNRNILPREDGTPEQVHFANVTVNFFQLMGARIAYGRNFIDADSQPSPPLSDTGAPGTQSMQRLPTIAILSYEFWQHRYGGNTSVLGKGMLAGGTAGPQVVGILAPRFKLFFRPDLNVEPTPDIWVASRLTYDNAQRNQMGLRVIGRLKGGITLERAQSEADTVAAELRKNFAVRETSGFQIRLEPMQKYLVADVEPTILTLMGGVTFLLIIACANVANLLLVRALLRERELAVRTALGGSWWRLVRQLLSEALLLSAIATFLGLGLAWAGIHILLSIAPANLPRIDSIQIDPVVLGFTALTGLLTAVFFGLPPALRAARSDAMQVLRASGRTAGLGSGNMLRDGVVIAEVALCFVLLIGSGLMFRSFVALQRIDPGYGYHGLLTFQPFGLRAQTPQQSATLMRQMRERLRSLPGVQNVTASTPFPLAGGFGPIRWGSEEALSDASKFQAVDFQAVLPGYFETLRTPLLAGRTFTDADNTPERNVVLIDQFLAAKAFPKQSAVGKRILIRIRTPEPEWVEVIGVVAHQRSSALAELGREQIYFTDGFLGHGFAGRWAIRTAGDPAKLAGAVRAEIAKFAPHVLITEMQPMEVFVDQAQEGTRFSLLLIGVFAAIATLLAAVGLYGVLSTAVRQRTAEIGVRMALGAAPNNIFTLIVGHGLRLSIIGIAVGLLAAFGLTRVMTSMLVGVKATDPTTFVTMAVLFTIIAALASWIPARRAARVDPMTALRHE